MKATEQYFPVVLFTMLYKVILTFEYMDKILTCDNSGESFVALLLCNICFFMLCSEFPGYFKSF